MVLGLPQKQGCIEGTRLLKTSDVIPLTLTSSSNSLRLSFTSMTKKRSNTCISYWNDLYAFTMHTKKIKTTSLTSLILFVVGRLRNFVEIYEHKQVHNEFSFVAYLLDGVRVSCNSTLLQ
jgi:hypothetical protein